MLPVLRSFREEPTTWSSGADGRIEAIEAVEAVVWSAAAVSAREFRRLEDGLGHSSAPAVEVIFVSVLR